MCITWLIEWHLPILLLNSKSKFTSRCKLKSFTFQLFMRHSNNLCLQLMLFLFANKKFLTFFQSWRPLHSNFNLSYWFSFTIAIVSNTKYNNISCMACIGWSRRIRWRRSIYFILMVLSCCHYTKRIFAFSYTIIVFVKRIINFLIFWTTLLWLQWLHNICNLIKTSLFILLRCLLLQNSQMHL